MAGTLDEAVEVVGVNGSAVVGSRETEGAAQEIGNEGIVRRGSREIPLVHREHQHMLEVEAARFEHAHHLQSRRRLPVEGDAVAPQQLFEQAAERGASHVEAAAVDQGQEAVDGGVHAEVGFGIELFEKLFRGIVSLSPVPATDGFRPDSPGQAVEVFVCVERVFVLPFLHVQAYQRKGRRMVQWEAFRDVHLLHLWRQGVQYGLEQLFVTHYDGCPLLVGRQVSAEPRGHCPCLRVLCRGCDEVNLFLLPQVVEQLRAEGVGELRQVAPQEYPRLEAAVVAGIGHVVVPIEESPPLLLERAEERFLHPVEHVEADEGIRAALVGQRGGLIGQPFRHAAVERALVGQSVGGHRVVDSPVNGQQCLPHGQELPFHGRIVLRREIAEEVAEHALLLLVERSGGFECLDVAQVAEEAFGVGHVLVHVVEVGQQPFAPPVEKVERVVAVRLLAVDAVQAADGLDRVGHAERRESAEEFADGVVGWCPYGAVASGGQVIVQEKAGALVREYDCHVAKVVSETVEQVAGDQHKEWGHGRVRVLLQQRCSCRHTRGNRAATAFPWRPAGRGIRAPALHVRRVACRT